jgi:hypothetical protein
MDTDLAEVATLLRERNLIDDRLAAAQRFSGAVRDPVEAPRCQRESSPARRVTSRMGDASAGRCSRGW